MAKYAVLSGDFVINLVVADTKDIAEQVTGNECILFSDENPAPIGGKYDRENNIFILI